VTRATIKKNPQGPICGRFKNAQELFNTLRNTFQLTASSLHHSSIDEKLAVAILSAAPERLVWADQDGGHQPSYLGHKISKCQTDGYFVAAILEENPYQLMCSLTLPCRHPSTEASFSDTYFKRFQERLFL